MTKMNTNNDIEPCDWDIIEDHRAEHSYKYHEPNYNYD